MATTPQEIDEVRRQMAQIRRELHEDVRGVVEGAEAATDWRRYVRNYPWAAMGVALAIGYLIVPRRHRSTATTIQLAASEVAKAIEPIREQVRQQVPAVKEKKEGKGLVRMALGAITPMILRAGQGYALQFAEQWLAQQMAKQQTAGGGGGLQDLAASFLGGGQPQAQAQQPPPPRQRPPAPGPQGFPPGAPRF